MTQELPSDEPTITIKSKGLTVPVPRDQGAAAGSPPHAGGLVPRGQVVQPQAHPEESFLVRNRWYVLVGSIVLALLLIGGTAFLLADRSKKVAAEILVRPAAQFDTVTATLADSKRPRSFSLAGRRARNLLGDFGAAKSRVDSEVKGDDVRKASTELLEAQLQYLNAAKGMRGVTEIDSPRFLNAERRIRRASGRVRSAVTDLKKFELPDTPTPYPSLGRVNSANKNLKELTSESSW